MVIEASNPEDRDMENIATAKRHINSAIKSVLSKYDQDWYANESRVEQNKMSEQDYALYSELFDAREQLIIAARKSA